MIELDLISTMTLATTGANGEPHAAPVYFVAIEESSHPATLPLWRLYYFSETKSQHAHDVSRDPRAAASLYPECWNWQEIRGMQMRGIINQVDSGQEWERAWDAYRAKFPFVRQLKALIARNSLYVFTPHWIRLVDNRRGFGYKKEWNTGAIIEHTGKHTRPP